MSETALKISTPAELLAASAATPAFRAAVAELEKSQKPSAAIQFGPGNPPVKVLRAICGLLEAFPTVAVDSVSVNAASGCSDYRGELHINGGQRKFRFVWDCAWKAEQLGWKDMFGSPDQQRAARAFGYRCFEVFEEVK